MISELIDALKKSFGAKTAAQLVIVLIVGAIFWQLYLYVDGINRESKKPFLQARLTYCQEIVSLVSQIAITSPGDTRQKAIDQFWLYYHGRLVLVETRELESAMINFAKALSHPTTAEGIAHLTYETTRTRPINQAALSVARACRDMLSWSWK
jgi:hypothetical protein